MILSRPFEIHVHVHFNILPFPHLTHIYSMCPKYVHERFVQCYDYLIPFCSRIWVLECRNDSERKEWMTAVLNTMTKKKKKKPPSSLRDEDDEMEAMSTSTETEVGSVESMSIASETVCQCSQCVYCWH